MHAKRHTREIGGQNSNDHSDLYDNKHCPDGPSMQPIAHAGFVDLRDPVSPPPAGPVLQQRHSLVKQAPLPEPEAQQNQDG